jgi:integrase
MLVTITESQPWRCSNGAAINYTISERFPKLNVPLRGNARSLPIDAFAFRCRAKAGSNENAVHPKSNASATPKQFCDFLIWSHSRSAVLNSLTSPSSQRAYDHAIRDFIDWYCSELRLAFNKTFVTRYRINLEQERYTASTINLRLAAVRRLAYEAADAGLLSPDLAAGIRRVKGAKKHGVRLGNWLTSQQGKRLLAVFDRGTVRCKRDYAIIAVLLGCGLRRAELATVTLEHLQQ